MKGQWWSCNCANSYIVRAWDHLVRKCELRKIQPAVAILRLLPELVLFTGHAITNKSAQHGTKRCPCGRSRCVRSKCMGLCKASCELDFPVL